MSKKGDKIACILIQKKMDQRKSNQTNQTKNPTESPTDSKTWFPF